MRTVKTRFGVTITVRRVMNDVGAAVTGPVHVLAWDEHIPVVVSVLWEGETERVEVEGMALAYTREHVKVSVFDRENCLGSRPWVPAADVRRIPL